MNARAFPPSGHGGQIAEAEAMRKSDVAHTGGVSVEVDTSPQAPGADQCSHGPISSGANRITFEIAGKPFAKQRPRFSRKSGRAYTPGETVSFERQVGMIAAQHFPRPLAGPVRIEIIATFECPPSWSKKKRADHLHRPHVSRPDLDNIGKAVCDGLNRIAFEDDAQISDMTIRKVWGLRAVTVVHLEGL